MLKHLVAVVAALALVSGCSGSGSGGTTGTAGASSGGTGGSATGTGGTGGTGGLDVDAGATTTIAAAVAANVTTPITVVGVVTALAGVPNDYPTWYIEDPQGGPNSGVAVYCNPANGCSAFAATPQGSLVVVTGSLSKYKGQLQMVPTKGRQLAATTTFPPIPVLTAADLAPSGNSPYRGVFVKYDATSLVVDSVTPSALLDTDTSVCETPGANGRMADGGLPQCFPLCEPPIYAGFEADAGAGNQIYVEAPFFNTNPLQSSPECLGQAGVTAVTNGTVFTSIQGILDVDPYGQVQYLAPMQPSDYAIK